MSKYHLIYLVFIFFMANAAIAQKIANKKDVEDSIVIRQGTLYGSLLVPKSKVPVPVVLMIPGSGPTDRNCNSAMGLNSNAFMMLAEALYKEKIATCRIDKRASGKSVHTFMKSLDSIQFNDFISDAELWIEKLKKDPRFSKVIVLGHSQGSLVGMVAAEQVGADAFISLAGAGRPIDNIMVDQYAAALPGIRDTCRMFMDSIKAGTYFKDAPVVLRGQLPKTLVPFLQQWMNYDPAEQMKLLKIPALVVNGTTDIQVDAHEAELLHEADPSSELLIIQGMNHILKNAPEERFANMATYNQPELALNEELVVGVIQFVKKQL